MTTAHAITHANLPPAETRALACPQTEQDRPGGQPHLIPGVRHLPYARVERVVSLTLRGIEVAVYAILRQRQRGGGTVTMSQGQIMAALGRSGDSRAVSRAVARLVAAGVVTTWQEHPEAPTTYAFTARLDGPRGYDIVPAQALAALRAGRMSPQEIRGWCFLDQMLGAKGWTAKSLDVHAMRAGVSTRTIRRWLATYQQELGLIVRHRPGGGLELRRIDAAPIPPDTTHQGRTRHPVPLTDQPLSSACGGPGEPAEPELAGQPADLCRDKNDGGAVTDLTAHKESTHEHPAPENCFSSRSADRPVADARANATVNGRKRPKTTRIQRITRDDVADLLWALDEEDRDWWCGQNTRWRGGLAQVLGQALDEGWTARQILTALRNFVDLDDHGGRAIPAARQALQALARQSAQGVICQVCANPEVIEGGRWCREHAPIPPPVAPGVPEGSAGQACTRCGSRNGVRDGLCWRHQPDSPLANPGPHPTAGTPALPGPHPPAAVREPNAGEAHSASPEVITAEDPEVDAWPAAETLPAPLPRPAGRPSGPEHQGLPGASTARPTASPARFSDDPPREPAQSLERPLSGGGEQGDPTHRTTPSSRSAPWMAWSGGTSPPGCRYPVIPSRPNGLPDVRVRWRHGERTAGAGPARLPRRARPHPRAGAGAAPPCRRGTMGLQPRPGDQDRCPPTVAPGGRLGDLRARVQRGRSPPASTGPDSRQSRRPEGMECDQGGFPDWDRGVLPVVVADLDVLFPVGLVGLRSSVAGLAGFARGPPQGSPPRISPVQEARPQRGLVPPPPRRESVRRSAPMGIAGCSCLGSGRAACTTMRAAWPAVSPAATQ